MRVLDWIPYVSPSLEFVILLSAFVAAVLTLYRVVYIPFHRIFIKWDHALDTLGGYPEITDRTGTVLKEATPPLANRVERLEDAFATLVDLNGRMTKVEVTLEAHMRWSEDWKHQNEIALAEIAQSALNKMPDA